MLWPFDLRQRDRVVALHSTAEGPFNSHPKCTELFNHWQQGILPSNSTLVGWIDLVIENPTLQPQPRYSSETRRFLHDLQAALAITKRMVEEKNTNEHLQTLCQTVALLFKRAYSGASQRQNILLASGRASHWYLVFKHEQNHLEIQKLAQGAVAVLNTLLLSEYAPNNLQDLLQLLKSILQVAELANESKPIKNEPRLEFPAFSQTTMADKNLKASYFSQSAQNVVANVESCASSESISPSKPATKDVAPQKDLQDQSAQSPTLPSLRPTCSSDAFSLPPNKDEVTFSNYERIDKQVREMVSKMKTSRLFQNLSTIYKFAIDFRQLKVKTGNIAWSLNDENSAQLFVYTVELLLKKLFNKDLDSFISATNKLFQTIATDVELKSYFFNWEMLCQQISNDSIAIKSEAFTERLCFLLNDGAKLLFRSTELTALIQDFSLNCSQLLESFLRDEIVAEFMAKWLKIFNQNLFSNIQHWTLSSMLHAFSWGFSGDWKQFIVPELVQQFNSLTIPELICSNIRYTLRIGNIRITPETILSSHCEIAFDNRIKLRARDRLFSWGQSSQPEALNGTRIVIRGIRTSFKDIYFCYEPRLTNAMKPQTEQSNGIIKGLVDVDVKKGFTLVVELYDSPQNKRDSFVSSFEVCVVHARFHGLQVRFHDTGMDSRLNWRMLYAGWYIKRVVQQAIQAQLRSLLEGIDRRFTKVRESMVQTKV